MERIDLPYVSGDAPLSALFDRMAESGVHAAIVALPGREPMLVTNEECDRAMEAGLTKSSQVDGAPLHVVAAEVEDWEGALDDAAASYGLVEGGAREGEVHDGDVLYEQEVVGAMVTIVTRHETLAYDIRRAGAVCRCRQNNHRAAKGRPCHICRSPVRCA